MKTSIFANLNDIFEDDRNDYKLVTEAGGPNFNKCVLDPLHPAAQKNTQLFSEKTTRETAHQAATAQKDAKIQRIAGQLATAKVLPENHVAIPVEEAQILQEIKARKSRYGKDLSELSPLEKEGLMVWQDAIEQYAQAQNNLLQETMLAAAGFKRNGF